MKYLGMDLGTRTIGLAISSSGILTTPYKLIRFKDVNDGAKEVCDIIKNENINVLVLGLPKNMDGSLGFASDRSFKFKELLESMQELEVNLVDERLTTVQAENLLISEDVSRKKRKNIIDELSACIILDTYLKKEK